MLLTYRCRDGYYVAQVCVRFHHRVTSETILLLIADAADELASSGPLEAIPGEVKPVSSYVIPVRGGVSRQVC
jgi:phage tail protein X